MSFDELVVKLKEYFVTKTSLWRVVAIVVCTVFITVVVGAATIGGDYNIVKKTGKDNTVEIREIKREIKKQYETMYRDIKWIRLEMENGRNNTRN